METRVSVISILVEDVSAATQINDLLHQFAPYIIGRMGLPYREKSISIICVVIDAPDNITSTLSGKLGMLKGVNTKTITSKSKK